MTWDVQESWPSQTMAAKTEFGEFTINSTGDFVEGYVFKFDGTYKYFDLLEDALDYANELLLKLNNSYEMD